MSADRRQLVDAIFSEALSLPGDVQERFVDDRCAGDPDLLDEVRTLLRAAAGFDDELEDRVRGVRDSLFRSMFPAVSDLEDLSGQRVGHWLIEKRIARGGLASVYQASRADGTYRQKAALKVLRRGLDTDDVISRFLAERQILSSLDHPSIARILDGGALDDGRPFLVLEYVDGVPITDYCEANAVDTRGRLVLLIDVLRVLHHAHQRLVVHRDVKPSNVLVSGDGRVTLLDFGIAKLLDPAAMPGASTLTRTGVSLMTPGYGSPEQRSGGTITTASDIYQVGLILFELITGRRPFADAQGRGFDEPPLPSRCLARSVPVREVRGDLDAITRKAMDPDPARRYASADDMLTDLERHLDGLPVKARPDTWRYRLAKLARRRPYLIPVVVLAALGVAAYVTTLTVYSRRLAHEEQLSAASQRFLIELFRSPDPFSPADTELGSGISVLEALDIGQRRIRTELQDQPELRASLLRAISEVYASLDDHRAAIDLREEALQLERAAYGERSAEVVASLRALGGLYGAKGDFERADRLLADQLALARDIHPSDSPDLGLSEIAAGLRARQRGDLEDSRLLLHGGLDKLRPEPSRYAREMIQALISLAENHGLASQQDALAAIREAADVASTVYGESSLLAATVRVRLAATMTMLGNYEESESNFLAAIPVLERQLGPDHGSTLSALNNLGYLYQRKGDDARAEEIHRQLLDRSIAKHGPSHRSVGDSYQNLAGAITKQGRYDESVPLHTRAYETFREVLNDDHYVIGFPLLSIAHAELERGRPVDAERAAREALQRFEAAVPGSFLEGVARCLLGLSLERQGRVEEGAALVDASHALMTTGSIPDPYPALCRLAPASESAG